MPVAAAVETEPPRWHCTEDFRYLFLIVASVSKTVKWADASPPPSISLLGVVAPVVDSLSSHLPGGVAVANAAAASKAKILRETLSLSHVWATTAAVPTEMMLQLPQQQHLQRVAAWPIHWRLDGCCINVVIVMVVV